MPGALASAPRDTDRPAEAAGCCCGSGKSGNCTDAAPPARSYSWHARQRLAARGLCLNCGQVPPEDGAKYCSGCIERRRASDRKAARKRRLLRRTLGACAECGAKPEKPRRRLCEACNEKHRAVSRRRMQDRKEERKRAGLCAQCGGRAPAEGNASCDDCLARRRRAYRARIDRRRRQADRSLCIECGKAPPAPGRRRCPDCQPLTARRDSDAARCRREARRAVGLCTVCGQHSAVPGLLFLGLSDGRFPGLFHAMPGLISRTDGSLLQKVWTAPECRRVVVASSRSAAPALRYGPFG